MQADCLSWLGCTPRFCHTYTRACTTPHRLLSRIVWQFTRVPAIHAITPVHEHNTHLRRQTASHCLTAHCHLSATHADIHARAHTLMQADYRLSLLDFSPPCFSAATSPAGRWPSCPLICSARCRTGVCCFPGGRSDSRPRPPEPSSVSSLQTPEAEYSRCITGSQQMLPVISIPPLPLKPRSQSTHTTRNTRHQAPYRKQLQSV